MIFERSLVYSLHYACSIYTRMVVHIYVSISISVSTPTTNSEPEDSQAASIYIYRYTSVHPDPYPYLHHYTYVYIYISTMSISISVSTSIPTSKQPTRRRPSNIASRASLHRAGHSSATTSADGTVMVGPRSEDRFQVSRSLSWMAAI